MSQGNGQCIAARQPPTVHLNPVPLSSKSAFPGFRVVSSNHKFSCTTSTCGSAAQTRPTRASYFAFYLLTFEHSCTGSDFAPTWASLHPRLSQTWPRGRSLRCSPGLPPHGLCPLPTHAAYLGLLTASLENPGLPFFTGQNGPAIRPLEIRCSSWSSCSVTCICMAVLFCLTH